MVLKSTYSGPQKLSGYVRWLSHFALKVPPWGCEVNFAQSPTLHKLGIESLDEVLCKVTIQLLIV